MEIRNALAQKLSLIGNALILAHAARSPASLELRRKGLALYDGNRG
jgi:hypothetical protein